MSKETLEAGLDLMRMNTVGSPAGSIDEQIKAPYTTTPVLTEKQQWCHLHACYEKNTSHA